MSTRLLFWVLMLLWAFFVCYTNWGAPHFGYVAGGSLLQFVLFGLLGWKVFGQPVRNE